MLGGKDQTYRVMYEKFMAVARKDLFFRPMTKGDEDILISGSVTRAPGQPLKLNPELQHLTCFTGGMVAIAGKIFNKPEDVKDGARLADGCVWAYRSTISGIMPETFTTVPCKSKKTCPWSQKTWMKAVDPTGNERTVRDKIMYNKLSPGMVGIQDGRYLLRYVTLTFSLIFVLSFFSFFGFALVLRFMNTLQVLHKSRSFTSHFTPWP